MNALTYKNQPLLLDGENFLTLKSGIEPSFGKFLIPSVKKIILTNEKNAPKSGTLYFKSDTLNGIIDKDGEVKQEILTMAIYNIWLVSATAVEETNLQLTKAGSTLPAILGPTWQIILADDRVRWPNLIGKSNYNIYRSDRSSGISHTPHVGIPGIEIQEGGKLDHLLDPTSLRDKTYEWTYREILSHLPIKFDILIYADDLKPFLDRKPRQIFGKGIPVSDILRQVLHQMRCTIGFPRTKSGGWVVYPIGVVPLKSDLEKIKEHTKRIVRSGVESYVNPHLQQPTPYASKSQSQFGVAATYHDGTGIKQYPHQIIQRHEVQSPTHIIPSNRAESLNYEEGWKNANGEFVTEPEQVSDESMTRTTVTNEALLKTLSEKETSLYNSNLNTIWRDTTYAGILEFTHGPAIQEITWISNEAGAFTQIKNYRPKITLPEIPNGMFNYGRWLLPRGNYDNPIDMTWWKHQNQSDDPYSEEILDWNIGGHTEDAKQETWKQWDQGPDQEGVKIDIGTGVAYSTEGTQTLLGFTRVAIFNSLGQLQEIRVEKPYVIDKPEPCS